MCGSASVPRGVDWKVSLKVPWVSSSKANLKIIGDLGCSWCVYANKQAKLKVGLKVVTLITMRIILGRKIMVQGKSQCSVLDIRMAQLTVLKVCFHLKVETGFVTSPKMFNLQARRTCQIATVRCHCSKGLANECLPKRQSRRYRDWFGDCCVNYPVCSSFCFHRAYAYDLITWVTGCNISLT